MTENQNESVKALETGIEQARAAIRAVREEQLTLPTPCEKWDVGQLLAHLAYDPGYMLEMVTGGSPDWSAIPDRVEAQGRAGENLAGRIPGRWRFDLRIGA